jgi:putative ABC transport system ATP-binding protein
MGPSGCSLSAQFDGAARPTSGVIEVDDAAPCSRILIRAGQCWPQSVSFSGYHLINDLAVLDNVELPLLYGLVSAGRASPAGAERAGQGGQARTHFPAFRGGGGGVRGPGQQPNHSAGEPGNLGSVMGKL